MKKSNDTLLFAADVSPLEDKKIFDFFYSLVPASRQEKTDRMKRSRDKLLTLGAGALLYYAAAARGVDLGSAEICYNANGKPYLKDYPDFHFSLSHSGSKVLCAVSDDRVGCDAEKAGRGNIKIARRYFTAQEQKFISEADDKDLAFCRLWTLKESYLKATGTGLTVALDSFSILISENGISVNADDNRFFFSEFGTDDGYRYACCNGENASPPSQVTEIDFYSLFNKLTAEAE